MIFKGMVGACATSLSLQKLSGMTRDKTAQEELTTHCHQ